MSNLIDSIYGRIRLERDDDLPDGRGAHYIVVLRYQGKEYTSSLECAYGEGAFIAGSVLGEASTCWREKGIAIFLASYHARNNRFATTAPDWHGPRLNAIASNNRV